MLALELLAVLVFGIFVGSKMKGKNKKRSGRPPVIIENIKVPFDLGIKNNTSYSTPLNNLRLHLENSLNSTYTEQVKSQIITKNLWSEKEFKVYLYGLKQYFLLNAVLKSVPMFSKEVDTIWHEMLMFTKEYQEFCERYIGEMIHHEPVPSNQKKDDPALRAEFDLLYSQFFDANDLTHYIYNGFYLFKLDEYKIKELEKMNRIELQKQYFKENKWSESIAKDVCDNLKIQIEQALIQKRNPAKKQSSSSDNYFVYSLFTDNPVEHKHHSDHAHLTQHHSSHHHSDPSGHHSCSSHSCSSHSCSSCSSCSS